VLTPGHEVVEPQHDPETDRVDVGVEECAAPDRLGGVAHDGVGDALVIRAVETLLDLLLAEGDDGLDAYRQVVGRRLRSQPGIAGDEGVDSVRGDDDPRSQAVLTSLDADELVALLDQGVDPDARHQEDPRLLALLGEPGVELRAQHGHRVHGLGQARILVVDADGRGGIQELDVVPGDLPFDRRLGQQLGKDLQHRPAVQDAAGQVLGARGLATLDQDHGVAGLRQSVGRHAPRDAGPDDDDVEVRFDSGFGHAHLTSGLR